jgi:hypothetical protein
MKLNTIVLLMGIHCCCAGQQQNNFNQKISIQSGYGMAGSFFVRSYDENQTSGASFYRKNFIGKTMSIGISGYIGQNFDLSFNYSFQEFNKRISYQIQTINGEVIIDDHSIRHINNIYDLTIRKKFLSKTSYWLTGVGIYYLRPIQQEIDIYSSSSDLNIFIQDRRHKNHNLNEGGALMEVAYEKIVQQKFRLGIKTQLFYTISTAQFESISLYPYIKYTF